MRLAKVAVASVSPTVGAVASNVSRLIAIAREMAEADVTLAAFPEQVVGGYPPEDLVQWRGFLDGQRREVERFASETAETATVFVLGMAAAVGGQLFNCAAIVHRGRILGLVPKEKLPTYNVFYEARTFSHGGSKLALDAAGAPLGDYIFRFDFGLVAIEVCEDAWSPDGPMRRRCYSGAEIVVNVSSSPYRMGIDDTRREMLATRSADNQAVLIYANAVGGQDGLTFDGGGLVFQNGRLVLAAPRFREAWTAAVVDLDRTSRLRMENTTWRSDCEDFRLQRLDVPVITCSGQTADRARPRLPGARRRQLLPARVGNAGRSARPRARRSVRGACAGREELLREDRGVPIAGHRALGRTRFDADAARRLARRGADRRRLVVSHHRLLHAEPAFAGRDEDGGAHAGRGTRR